MSQTKAQAADREFGRYIQKAKAWMDKAEESANDVFDGWGAAAAMAQMAHAYAAMAQAFAIRIGAERDD